MADDAQASNTLTAAVRHHANALGDVPASLRRRYAIDDRGEPGLGFYVDPRAASPAFRDRGRRLEASRTDPVAIADMISIASHRGWTIVMVHGEIGFRRESWLAGRLAGVEVRGYRPTERDMIRLQDRSGAQARNDWTEHDRSVAARAKEKSAADLDAPGPRSHLRIIEAVVRTRVADPDARARILTGARERMSLLLGKGARFEELQLGPRGRSR